MRLLNISLPLAAIMLSAISPSPAQNPVGTLVPPSRPVALGNAPHMQSRQIKSTPEEQVYVLVFHAGDEAMSGLTDFAIANKITDAHFTAIGAVSSATLGWFDLKQKQYRPVSVESQHEVLSLIGDIAVYRDKPVVHMHASLSGADGKVIGGHAFELHVLPLLEVYLTVNTAPVQKKLDPATGLVIIDPAL